MARTTVDIDSAILKEIKKIQKRDGRSLGAIISELLGDALARQAAAEPPAQPLNWISQPMEPKLDLREKDAIWKALNDEDSGRRR